MRSGQTVKMLPSGKVTTIERVFIGMDEVEGARAGQSVTFTVRGDFDISRGDMIVDGKSPAEIADQFRASVIWMQDQEMLPGRNFILKMENARCIAKLAKPRYRVNVNDYQKSPTDTLVLNDIGSCNLSLDRSVVFDPYSSNRSTGSFILIDPDTNATAGAGMIEYALRRSQNIHWQRVEIELGRANKQRLGFLRFSKWL